MPFSVYYHFKKYNFVGKLEESNEDKIPNSSIIQKYMGKKTEPIIDLIKCLELNDEKRKQDDLDNSSSTLNKTIETNINLKNLNNNTNNNNTNQSTADENIDDFVDELSKEILRFTIKHRNNKCISFIVNRDNNLTTKPLKINSKKINMDWHYNDNFKEINNKIISKLRINNSKGLFLFYGEPGTGKSTYIKYLIQKVRKEVIFLSPKMAANIDNMSFIEFLLENPNKILVIEDAEELIVSRDNKHLTLP